MGFFRVLLALGVVFDHLGPLKFIFGSLTAVFVFFMISGFYMALILNTKYSQLDHGIKRFYINRALRIYPTYFAILILVSLLGYKVEFLASLGDYWDFRLFPTLLITLSNIFIFGLDMSVVINPSTSFNFIGPAWTLGAELLFYLIAPLVVLKRPLVAGLLIIGSLILRIYLTQNGYANVPWLFNFFPSILMFFLLGHVGYLIYSRIKTYQISKSIGRGIICLFLVYIAYKSFKYGNFFLNFLDPTVHKIKGFIFYSAITISIPFVFLATKDSRVDNFIGKLSYSIYLLHLPIHFLILSSTKKLDFFAGYDQLDIFGLSLAVIIALSLCLYFFIEKPIEAVRRRVENNV
jgi:peptidoglycan/LPS O-acetylase OafA/YrhL